MCVIKRISKGFNIRKIAIIVGGSMNGKENISGLIISRVKNDLSHINSTAAKDT